MVSWKFGLKGIFSVKSVYNALTVNEIGRYHKKIWKGKILEKLKKKIWMALNNAILTKDNMVKRKCVPGILHVTSVLNLRLLTICYFNVVLPRWFGPLWLFVLGLIMYPGL